MGIEVITYAQSPDFYNFTFEVKTMPQPLFEYDPENRRAKCYVLWADSKVLFTTNNKTFDKVLEQATLGICGYSGRVFKVAPRNSWASLIVNDIFINDPTQEGGCEEGKRCLDFSCPKNRTTWETFKKAHSIHTKKPPVGFGFPIWCNVGDDGDLLSFKEYFDKYPKHTYLAMPEDGEIQNTENKNNNRKQRNSLRPGERFDIFKRDGYRCQICGRTAKEGVRLEIDHKHPVARGGANNLLNLWVLCQECNIGKGTKSI